VALNGRFPTPLLVVAGSYAVWVRTASVESTPGAIRLLHGMVQIIDVDGVGLRSLVGYFRQFPSIQPLKRLSSIEHI
jgi:hypothetical protein